MVVNTLLSRTQTPMLCRTARSYNKKLVLGRLNALKASCEIICLLSNHSNQHSSIRCLLLGEVVICAVSPWAYKRSTLRLIHLFPCFFVQPLWKLVKYVTNDCNVLDEPYIWVDLFLLYWALLPTLLWPGLWTLRVVPSRSDHSPRVGIRDGLITRIWENLDILERESC